MPKLYLTDKNHVKLYMRTSMSELKAIDSLRQDYEDYEDIFFPIFI